jgi:hypothetical protein
MVEKIEHGKQLLAIIISHEFNEEGIHFFTPVDFSQQLAYMHHQPGKIIEPHTHNPVTRQVSYTQEVLFIKRGKVRVDFYDKARKPLLSRILEKGDVILTKPGSFLLSRTTQSLGGDNDPGERTPAKRE